MKKEVTLGQALSITVGIISALLVWGFSINSRLSENYITDKNQDNRIKHNEAKVEKVDDKVDQNFKEIQLKLDRIIENQKK